MVDVPEKEYSFFDVEVGENVNYSNVYSKNEQEPPTEEEKNAFIVAVRI